MIVRGQRRLRLVLPWLGVALDAAVADGWSPARAPAAEWLVARGRIGPRPRQSWREWLMAGTDSDTGLLVQFPAGPCVRALCIDGPPEGTWACARPVHLMTAIDHLLLARGKLQISADESSTLLDDINRHFEGRGFRLHASAAVDDWQLECAEPVDCTSIDPADAAGLNLRGLMPGGRDGGRTSSLINEIQMLLHDHPVNVSRASRGLPAINSLWLWGFGRLSEASTTDLPVLYTDDDWLAGLWRLHGAASRSLQEFAASASSIAGEALFAWSIAPHGGMDEALTEAERCCFAPAMTALRSGALDAVDMLLGERVIELDLRARFRFWRRATPLAEALA